MQLTGDFFTIGILLSFDTSTAKLCTGCRSSKIYHHLRTSALLIDNTFTGAIPFISCRASSLFRHFTASRGYASTRLLHRPCSFIFLRFQFLYRGLVRSSSFSSAHRSLRLSRKISTILNVSETLFSLSDSLALSPASLSPPPSPFLSFLDPLAS